jgi:hypothetical protein
VRFFRTADEALYESIRSQLDQAWGHPSADGRTQTCFDPASTAPRDSLGRLMLSIRQEFATWEPAATLLPQLISSGAVEEIDAETYQAALPPARP